MDEANNYEQCWNTGIYDGYDCEMCPYKNECSGYEYDKVYSVDGHTQIEADIIRLRRELLILKSHVREEEDV